MEALQWKADIDHYETKIAPFIRTHGLKFYHGLNWKFELNDSRGNFIKIVNPLEWICVENGYVFVLTDEEYQKVKGE